MDPVDRIIYANSQQSRKLLLIDSPKLISWAYRRSCTVSIYCDDIRNLIDAQLPIPDLIFDPGIDAVAPDGYEPTESESTPAVITKLTMDTIEMVDQVWMRIPTSLDALDEYAQLLARRVSPAVTLLAAQRDKYLTRSMNDVLARYFHQVRASLGNGKARALIAVDPRPSQKTWPRSTVLKHSKLPEALTVWTHGATFAGTSLDAGTRLMLTHIAKVADADRYCDLGCGSGILTAALGMLHPDCEILGVDVSLAAVRAARLTADRPNVTIRWQEGLSGLDPGSLDVICCNPPFHRGTAKDSRPARAMFAQAGKVLCPGGEFWCVFNSHLPWKVDLFRAIGPTKVVAQNRGYTLTCSRKRV